MTSKFTVQGVEFRTSTQRRYVVVAGRKTSVEGSRWSSTAVDGAGRQGAYVPCTFPVFSEIVRRSDSVATARAAASKYGRPTGGFVAVIDTTTGKEV